MSGFGNSTTNSTLIEDNSQKSNFWDGLQVSFVGVMCLVLLLASLWLAKLLLQVWKDNKSKKNLQKLVTPPTSSPANTENMNLLQNEGFSSPKSTGSRPRLPELPSTPPPLPPKKPPIEKTDTIIRMAVPPPANPAPQNLPPRPTTAGKQFASLKALHEDDEFEPHQAPERPMGLAAKRNAGAESAAAAPRNRYSELSTLSSQFNNKDEEGGDVVLGDLEAALGHLEAGVHVAGGASDLYRKRPAVPKIRI